MSILTLGKKIKSTIMVDEDIWKEIKIQAIRENMEIGELVESIFKKYLGISNKDNKK
jgi:hypothetical protein